jgi:NitT/TauT family transport system ATP-binding protein
MSEAQIGVRVDDVSHWFPSPSGPPPRPVLDDISLHARPGEFVCLIGPSGCGKTTLLSAVAGVLAPEAGTVRLEVGGVDTPTPITAMGYMQARDALMPWRTVAENVSLALEFQGVPRAQRRPKIDAAIEMVGLTEARDRHPRQLSQGMRQRANLARMLAGEPRLMLMDEPFGALDAQTKAMLQAQFAAIWQRDRATVLFVTHDLEEAALLGDRIVVMVEGRIAADVTVPFARPRDPDELRFSADFQQLVRDLWPMLRSDRQPTSAASHV